MESKISGLYTGGLYRLNLKKANATKLELRVDIDGERPLNVVSGDLFSDTGEYLESFRSKVKFLPIEANTIQLLGEVVECNPCLDPICKLEILIIKDSEPQEATVRLTNVFGAQSNYACQHKSKYFRTILLEHDYEEGIVPLEPYDPTTFPSPSKRKQPISISSSFAEAGIEVTEKKKENPIPHPKGTPDGEVVWTDKQLHEAMLEHFKGLSDKPQWKLWLLSANEYVICTTEGLMLTHDGKRRGCVVFQIATGWQAPEDKRLRFFIYMHELGHCFGLTHPWTNFTENQNQDGGFATLSWMNYPWRYRLSKIRGNEDFWQDFNFEFSTSDLMHLRHGFRNDVIFGGRTTQ